jgi:hypothetical protein
MQVSRATPVSAIPVRSPVHRVAWKGDWPDEPSLLAGLARRSRLRHVRGTKNLTCERESPAFFYLARSYAGRLLRARVPPCGACAGGMGAATVRLDAQTGARAP